MNLLNRSISTVILFGSRKSICTFPLAVTTKCLTKSKQHGQILWYSTDQSPGDHFWRSALSPEARNRLYEIEVELTLMHQSSLPVCNPAHLRESEWSHLLTLRSISARKRYYKYLYEKHLKQALFMEAKEQARKSNPKKQAIEQKARKENTHINYDLMHTSIYPRIRPITMDKHRNVRTNHAQWLNAQKLIFDLSYDQYMHVSQHGYLASQLQYAFNNNRRNLQPFDMHVCNANESEKTMEVLSSSKTLMFEPNAPVQFHTESICKRFPLDRMVYIIPNSPHRLQQYNPNDMYVVPVINDRNHHGPITLLRAKQLNIRTAWFPFDNYFKWQHHWKWLPLETITDILLELKNTGNWKAAFKCLPDRYVRTSARDRTQLYTEGVMNIRNPFIK